MFFGMEWVQKQAFCILDRKLEKTNMEFSIKNRKTTMQYLNTSLSMVSQIRNRLR